VLDGAQEDAELVAAAFKSDAELDASDDEPAPSEDQQLRSGLVASGREDDGDAG
jgi:hypothetical protein